MEMREGKLAMCGLDQFDFFFLPFFHSFCLTLSPVLSYSYLLNLQDSKFNMKP